MNRPIRPARLALEQFEDRWVPATISFNGSTLSISNPSITVSGTTSLQVTEGATGFSVTDNGRGNGTFNAGNINITGSSAPNNISVVLNSTGLSGNLSITGGNANDTISVSGATASDKIGGSLTIAGGNGNSSFSVGATANGLVVGGATQLYGGLGTDTATLGNNAAVPAKFLGGLGLHAFATASLTATLAELGTNYTLGSGKVTIDEVLHPGPGGTKLAAVNVTLNGAAQSVGGPLQIVDGFGNSTVSLGSDSVGSLSINLGRGNNSVSLTGVTVKGSAALTFSTGPDTVTINGGTVVNSGLTRGGSLALSMGDAANVYTLSNFTVNGNVTITAPASGSVGQTITFGGTINAIVGDGSDGNLTVNLGNGDNSFTFAGSIPFAGTFSYDAPPLGKHITLSGNDTVTIDLNANQFIYVNLHFGSGHDQLNWYALGANSAAAGTVTGVNGFFANYSATNMGNSTFTVNTNPNSPGGPASGVQYYSFPTA